jgi:hypothetical protein
MFFELLLGVFAVGALLSRGSKRRSSVSSTPPVKQKEKKKDNPSDLLRKIRDKNDEIDEIEKKKEIDGIINWGENDRLTSLKKDRLVISQTYDTVKQNELITNINDHEDQYRDFKISENNLHIIQYHIGQATFGHLCSRCNKPMQLQFPRDQMIISSKSLFWGCTGWYDGSCNANKPFSTQDLSLLSENRDEFQFNQNSLTEFISDSTHQNDVRNRFNNYRGVQVEQYLCPIHKEPMVLRRKNNPNGLLDEYFLGCRKWNPNGGCNQIIKLKSAAQLAAFLQVTEGKGLV